MSFTAIVTIGLAAFSITFLLRYVDGPLGVFAKIREIVVDNNPVSFFAELFSCFWCLGFWISCLMLLLYIYCPEIVWLFAVYGVVGFLHEEVAK